MAEFKKSKRKKHAAQITLMPTTWDMGANGPANRIGLVEEERGDIDPTTGRRSNPNGVKGVRRVPWILTYHKQGHLTVEQWNIATMLREAADCAPAADPLAALRIDRIVGGDPQAARFDRRRKFLAMWANVPGHARPVIERVVINDCPLWRSSGPQRERHMLRMRQGLDALANVHARG